MISLKSRVVTPLSDNKFSNDYLSSSTSSPFSNRLYFTGVGQRPSTSSSLYSKGRLLASSSVERLNRSESPPPAFRGGSSWDLRSSSPMRRPRHPSVDRFRRTDHHPSYRSISRDELSSIDLSASPGNSLQTSSIMERRNMIISNFNRSLPPSGLAPTSLISHHPHHNLHPRSNFAASRNNLTNLSNSSATRPWPSAGLDVFRPRIRDRPSLASIKSSIKSRIKPSDSSSRYSKAAPVSSDASLRLSRYRHVIKFREFHIDEPINKRKASISWDLPLEPISSSSSYNSKSSQNDSSVGSHSSTSRQSSVEKETKMQTMTKPDTNDAKNEKNELTSTSFPQSSIHRQNSVSRSRSSQKSSHQTPKIKVPKLEITPVSVMNQTSPDVIELPKPVSPLRVHFEVSISRLEFIPIPDQTNQENNSFEVNVVLPLKAKSKSPDPSMLKSQIDDPNKSNVTKQQQEIIVNKSEGSIPKITSKPQTPPTPSSTSRLLPPPSPPTPCVSISPRNESTTSSALSSSALKLPKGRTKPSSDKDRPSGKPIYHHRKPSSPDPSCISPIPGESPTSSRLPSPSPSLILSIEEKSRKILSKSGSTSPVPMSSNKLLSANSNETGAIKGNNSASTSPSSSVSSRSVVNPRQELKLSIVNDSSSSGIKFSENLSSTHSSPPSSVSSRVPGTTTKTSLSSSSSSPSPSVTEAKCKGLKLSKEMEETKKRSLTPSRPNNRSSSPSLPLTSNSSPLTPPNSNQVNSERSESSRVDSSDKINPSPPVPTNHSPMPKSSVDKVKGSLNLPAAPKSSSVSPKPSANSSSNKVTKNTLTSKSNSCPPTPTENYPSYVVKTKNSSTAKSSEKQLQEKLISKNSGKSKAPAKSSPESSSTPSSPQILQGANPATSPILLELNKKSKTKSSESLKQQKQQSTKLSSSDKKGKPEKSVESEEVKQPSVVEPINQAMSASSDKQNSETIKGKDSFEPLDGKFNTANKQASVKEKNENDAKRNSSAKTPSVKSSPTSSTKQTVQGANDLKNAEIPQIQSSQVKTERMSSKLKTDKLESKEGINKKGEDKVNTEKEIKVEKEDTKKDHKEGKSEALMVDENVTRKESNEKINAADEKEVTQTNKHQNNTKDGDRINGLNKFLVNGNLEEPSIIDNKKERKRIRFRPYTMDDFELRKVLGRGSFGKVYLAQLKGHDVFFAIKFLKKHVVIEDDDLESIMVERKVLALGVRHPFICKLFCTFQTRGMVCFVMEFLAGGDLMFHVQSSGRFTEDRSRFYAAEIVSALNFLHSRYIIYRDLKLDNILLDAEGHVRLVDFGMCQCHIWKEECLPSNFCGTPEYMAPEIIKGVQYNQAVDWWSFGVLLYEMIVGDSPFKATDEDELLWNVCYEKVRIPYFVSKNAQSIILSLLEYDPAERLGMPTSSKGDIRSHKFFESINWDAINAAKVKPPFVPNLKNQFDTCYFDREFTEMRPVLTPIDDYTVENVDHELFFGFDYTNPNMTD